MHNLHTGRRQGLSTHRVALRKSAYSPQWTTCLCICVCIIFRQHSMKHVCVSMHCAHFFCCHHSQPSYIWLMLVACCTPHSTAMRAKGSPLGVGSPKEDAAHQHPAQHLRPSASLDVSAYPSVLEQGRQAAGSPAKVLNNLG